MSQSQSPIAWREVAYGRVRIMILMIIFLIELIGI